MATRGFCYIAYGDKARNEARLSIESLRQSNAACDVVVIGDAFVIGGATKCSTRFLPFDDIGAPGRWAKVNLDTLSEFDLTCYIDADTRVNGDLQAGFDLLGDFDVAITASDHQADDVMWHIGEEERKETLYELGNPYPLQLQAGMFFFKRNDRTHALFDAWRCEWLRWREQDQAALLRALYRTPVKLLLLGRCWNGGAIVAHRFGVLH